ncbi:hypothetical protein [Microbacterium sp. P05]|uniref:hypothetical protein n=1 Tax=Microbacterium sp. P05 TaxID=3366948 RepID=UPI003745645C
MLLDVTATTVNVVAGAIVGLGFQTLEPTSGSPMHRFVRGPDVVDVMVARNVNGPTRWRARPLLRSPGAAQALRRRDTYTVMDGDRSIDVDVPDAVGAIVAKSAAFTVDPRNPARHLEDLVVLAAAAGPVRSLDLASLSRKDRRHLSRPVALLTNARHPAWDVLDAYDRVLGQRVWAAIEEQSPPGGSRKRYE